MDLGSISLDASVRDRAVAQGATTSVWPLSIDRKRGLVAVQQTGLHIIRPNGSESCYSWDDLADLDVEEFALRLRPEDQSEPTRYALEHRLHGKEIREAIAAAGGPVGATAPESAEMPQWRDAATSPGGQASGVARRSAAPVTNHAAKAALKLTRLFITGVLVQLGAGVIIGLAWPSTEIDPFTETTSDSGSALGVAFGFSVAWVGAALIGVAVIGWGVMLGNRASGKPAT
jgi:hypothetical protein